MHIAVLGLGRLGRTLAPALAAAGHQVSTWRRGEPLPAADVRWITVRDDAIARIAAALPPGGVVLHSSGALDLAVLAPHRPAGSLHPLQTFPGPEIGVPPLAGLPAAIAGDPEALAVARALCADLGWLPFEVQGDRRLYHAACTLAGNFPTVLLAEAVGLLRAAGVVHEDPLALLLPLARAALENAGRHGPTRALTGPVARGESATIQAHAVALAAAAPDLLPLYAALLERARVLADPPAGSVESR